MDQSNALEIQPQYPAPAFVEQSQSMMTQLAAAQIQSRYIMALRAPRNIDMVRQEMLKECSRPSFCVPDDSKNGSSVAIYRVPRAGSNIEGVTIRFAEMCLRAYRNLNIDVVPLGEDDKQKLYQVNCTDFEANNVTSEIVTVPKSIERSFTKDSDVVLSSRLNSKNKTVYTILGTDDDLAMKRNALISKARRNLIMQNIPGWLVEECIAKVRETARAKDAQDPDAAKRKLYDAFATIGVTAEQLGEYLGHSNALNPSELETLRDYYSAIREGYTTWREIVAQKEDNGEASEQQGKRIEALFAALEMIPAQIRKMKTTYIGRTDKLVEYLEGQLAKKQNTGAAQNNPVEPAVANKERGVNTQQPQSADAEPAAPVSAQPEPKPQQEKPKAQPRQQQSAPPINMDAW